MRALVTAPPARPKLVLVLVVDDLPSEQAQRYREQFGQGGFRRLLHLRAPAAEGRALNESLP